MYASEVRFYREVLAISWEFGSQLRSLGALVPDAILDTGGVIYELTPEKLAKAHRAVSLAKTRGFKDQPPNPFPHEKRSLQSLSFPS